MRDRNNPVDQGQRQNLEIAKSLSKLVSTSTISLVGEFPNLTPSYK